ncbi:PIR protein, putative [Plasmodium sp. gorilla clade G1]|nr:PIR protein, putative [Plasmodium sp. gorilla clade G1]
MKFNFTNILLFSLSLNILLLASKVYNQRNHYITHHTPKSSIRLLCECDIYTSIYNNDQEMQKVIQDFDRQTSQRFEEYNEHKIKKRQKCKEQCDKEIQKIILKDKIEKELTEKLSTLQIDISSDDIPTCVCEKSLTDKTENFCLKCGYGLGGGVAPSIGLLGGMGMYGWKMGAMDAAIAAAAKAGAAKGAAAGVKAGIEVVIDTLGSEFGINKFGGSALKFVFDETNYTKVLFINNIVYTEYQRSCVPSVLGNNKPICNNVTGKIFSGYDVSDKAVIKKSVESIASEAEMTTGAIEEMITEEATATLTIEKTGEVNATYASCQTAIIASVVAILVIVLVMVIIYLILRYRRKKKMKKKLQYIKLLKE